MLNLALPKLYRILPFFGLLILIALTHTSLAQTHFGKLIPVISYLLLEEDNGTTKPTIFFNSPNPNQVFEIGDSVTVDIAASVSDGSISKIDLWLNDTIVSSDTSSPYQWNGGVLDTLSIGDHSLRATATDNLGNTASVVQQIHVVESNHQPPTVNFLLPTQNTFLFGALIIVEANASNSDNTIASVQLFVDDVLVRQEVNPPYTWNDTSRGAADPVLDNLSVGQHTLRLVATDDHGVTSEVSRTITITAPSGNTPPNVSITSPSNHQSFDTQTNVIVSANASDSDGSVTKVDLYVNNTLNSSDTTAPYSWNLGNLTEGTYTLRVVATDDGQLTHENSISITVQDTVNSGEVTANIKASRTTCASPCSVVLSAEDSTATGLDEYTIWTNLTYHWDFDTDESDTYGSLYDQEYTYVEGDTAFEKGYVPMVTKTFLCETGTCVYNVGLRVQNRAGDYDDVFQSIVVNSESAQWSSANTICVSNSLNITSNWTNFDKSCPVGAVKQSSLPGGEQYDGKLVLLHRGDVFTDLVEPGMGQRNFKIGYFGNYSEPRPELLTKIEFLRYYVNGVPVHVNSSTNPLTDSDVSALGWHENITIEGLRVEGINFPISFQHIGIHDIDIDQRQSTSTSKFAGLILFHSAGAACRTRSSLSCSNIPISKGGYISKTNIVGSSYQHLAVNVYGGNCPMVNNLGFVDSSVMKTIEHNLRLMGWYRLSIMRSFFRGHHERGDIRQKITPRPCYDSGGSGNSFGDWNNSGLQATYADDVDGRPVSDLISSDNIVHVSRYQVTVGNRIGDPSPEAQGANPGGGKYQSNSNVDDQELMQNIIVTNNIFTNDPDARITGDISLDAHYSGCFLNTYSGTTVSCGGSSAPDKYPGFIQENLRAPYIAIPNKPGS